METPNRNWYVEIGETVYEAATETIDQWIWNGTVLSQHRVSRGGQRWIEAGKAPQFARHFSSPQQVNELFASEGIGFRRATPGAESPSALTQGPGEAITQPFGVKLLAGSAIALVIALIGGYLWAYHLSSPKDLSVINNSPEMLALQGRYDTEKTRLEGLRASLMAPPKPKPASPATWNGPEFDEHLIDCDRVPSGKYDRKMPWGCSDESKAENRVKTAQKIKVTPPSERPGVVPAMLTDTNDQLTNIDVKFETDKKTVIAEARSADSRSKFYQAFVLMFLGLAGLNLARLSLSPKK